MHDASVADRARAAAWRRRDSRYSTFGGTFNGKYAFTWQPFHDLLFRGLSPTNRVGAIAFNDVNFRAKLPWKALVAVGTNNPFDRQPPLTYSSLSNSGSGPVQGAYDLDRYMHVSYQQDFWPAKVTGIRSRRTATCRGRVICGPARAIAVQAATA